MVEKVSNNKKDSLFGRIVNQITQEMKEGEKEELAGLRRNANNNKASNKKAQPAKLTGSTVEQKQLPGSNVEAKQPAGSKTSVKKRTTTKKTSIKAKKAVPSYSGVTSDGRPAWVQAMDNTRKQAEEEAAVTATSDNTFAGQYLMPTPSNSRRKPGPSLNMFKDMARQVKIPKNVKKG